MTRTERFAKGTILTSPKGDMVVEALILRGTDTEPKDMRLRNADGQTAEFPIVIIERAIDAGTMTIKEAE